MNRNLIFAAAAATVAFATPASAQMYSSYLCDNGFRFAAAFFDGYAAGPNLDGKSLLLPERVAIKGQQYSARDIAKGGD